MIGTVEPASTRRKVSAFAVVGLALLMMAIDQTAVSVALPDVADSLDTSVGLAGWCISGALLGQIIAMPVAGFVSDHWGRRRVFLICLVMFTGASLGSAFAPNIYVLVALRVIQGLGGGGFLPSATGIVSDVFGAGRDRGIALFTSIFPVGNMAGPVLGGFIVEKWSWREVFAINVPIGLLCLAAAVVILPGGGSSNTSFKFDWLGLALMSVSFSVVLLSVTALGGDVPVAWVVTGLVGASAALTWLYKRSQGLQHPVLPVKFMRRGPLQWMNVVMFLYGGVIIGISALVPLYGTLRYGLTPLEAGGALAGRAVGSAIVTSTTAILLRRIGTRLPLLVGLTLAATGTALLAVPSPFENAVQWLALCTLITGLGGGMAAPASNVAGLAFAGDEIGSVSALRGLSRQAGGIVYVAVGGAIVSITNDSIQSFGGIFLAFAVGLIAIAIPLALRVPDQRNRW